MRSFVIIYARRGDDRATHDEGVRRAVALLAGAHDEPFPGVWFVRVGDEFDGAALLGHLFANGVEQAEARLAIAELTGQPALVDVGLRAFGASETDGSERVAKTSPPPEPGEGPRPNVS